MSRILLVYGTREGHTARIAEEIATTMRAEGHEVDVRDLQHTPAPSIDGYDAVLVGASVHARGYEHEVRHWVGARAGELARLPNGFFSVSLSAANHDAKSVAEMDEVIKHFSMKTGWWPQHVARFAGALVYSQYNWMMKRVMRWIVRHESDDDFSDMTRDYDLTDYAEVAAFAKSFADMARTAEALR